MMDWSVFYFWEMFRYDAMTIIGLLLLIPAGFIGWEVGELIKRKFVNNCPNSEQTQPRYPKYPVATVGSTINELSNNSKNHQTADNRPKPFEYFILIVTHIVSIIHKVKSLCQRKKNDTELKLLLPLCKV